MEDHRNELKNNNVIHISNVISKLLNDIEKSAPLNEQEVNKMNEFKLLKEKCCDNKPEVSVTALHGLKKLVEKGIVSGSHAMFILISLIPSVVHHSELVFTIGNLLLFDLRQKVKCTGIYSCQFDIINPEHPIITVLKYNLEKSWDSVLLFIQYVLHKSNDIEYVHKIELLSPVFLHILCDPSQSSLPVKNQLCFILLDELNQPAIQKYLLKIVSLQQLDMGYCLFTRLICEQLFKYPSEQSEQMVAALAPFLALDIKWLIINGHNPILWIDTLKSCLNMCEEVGSAVLFLLADVIVQTPALYLQDLVELCKCVIFKGSCNRFIAHKTVSALLNWMVNSSILVGDLSETVEEILSFLTVENLKWNNNSNKLLANGFYNILKHSNSSVNFAIDMSRISDSWATNKKLELKWLNNLSTTKHYHMQRKLQLFLSGIVICEEDEEILDVCLQLLLDLVNVYSDLSFSLLCLIFFKLSRESEPSMQMKYLLCLPKMAVERENIPIIISTIASLKNGNPRIMTPVVIRLNLSLWKIEGRTYPYLHEMLTVPSPSGEEGWEITACKTLAMREICKSKPELLGKDLVLMLSEVLNASGDEANGLCSAVALDSITELCKAYVIDVVGTWRALEPKLSKDKRHEVIMSLCKMFSEVPSLESSEQEYEKLTHDIIGKLWTYVMSNDHKIAAAAMEALGRFKVESFQLKPMPEAYRRGLRLPKDYAKTPVEAARKPEDVLPYVPGECWVQLLQKTTNKLMTSAGNMLIELLGKELDSFPRGVFYSPPDKTEPTSYSFLPHRSILRALVEYIQKKAEEATENVSVEEALRILQYDFTKNFPPLNWSFLNNFVSIGGKCSFHSIALAGKQGSTSASAKYVVESYIVNYPCDQIEEVISLYSLLPRLCNSVQPNSLRSFIEKSLKLSIDTALTGDIRLFEAITSNIATSLQMKTVHEANKTLLVMQLENVLILIPATHEMMKLYANCAVQFPTKYLERISAPSLWWEITPEKICQSLVIRSAVAVRSGATTPLVWLNECIDAACNLVMIHDFALRTILSVIEKCRENENNPKWLLELMGRTQALISSGNAAGDSTQAILFLVDIFMCSTIVLSGHICLVNDLEDLITIPENRLQMLPNAVEELFCLPRWLEILPQVTEWIHGLLQKKELIPEYQAAFVQSIKSLRGFKYCHQNARWPRFFSKSK